MKNETTRKAALALLFAQYPSTKSFHMTSDHQAFTLETDAKNHAKSLEDKTVEEVFRNSRAMTESDQELSKDALQKVINNAGVTDENGNLLSTSGTQETVQEEKLTAVKKAPAPAKAKAAKAVKPVVQKEKVAVVKTADKVETKADTDAADKKDEKAEADVSGGTDAK
jgi:hypothetical protein